MPKLNGKYPSEPAKRRKKEESINVDQKCKVDWTDLLSQVVLVSLERRVQLQAPKLLIVAMSV